MGIVLDKIFGPGAAPLVEVETQGACSSQCCEDLEVVSSSPDTDEEGVETGSSTLQVDYSRLVTVLWGVCKDLTSRVATLEAQR
jgi:hypothetical protein